MVSAYTLWRHQEMQEFGAWNFPEAVKSYSSLQNIAHLRQRWSKNTVSVSKHSFCFHTQFLQTFYRCAWPSFLVLVQSSYSYCSTFFFSNMHKERIKLYFSFPFAVQREKREHIHCNRVFQKENTYLPLLNKNASLRIISDFSKWESTISSLKPWSMNSTLHVFSICIASPDIKGSYRNSSLEHRAVSVTVLNLLWKVWFICFFACLSDSATANTVYSMKVLKTAYSFLRSGKTTLQCTHVIF